MLIGVDFDNTIVCYDSLIYRVAHERELVPTELPPTKGHVRDFLRACGLEDRWTEMQGYIYGARMMQAAPFPGVLEFFSACRRRGIPVYVVSHKTRQPFKGPSYDLHLAARLWLESQRFHDPDGVGLLRSRVFLELTKQGKLERISELGCTHFIDDLPEFLAEPSFPKGVERILFDPNGQHVGEDRFRRVSSWGELNRLLGNVA